MSFIQKKFDMATCQTSGIFNSYVKSYATCSVIVRGWLCRVTRR